MCIRDSFCVVRVNPAAEKLFGFEAKALTGARLRDLLDNELSLIHISEPTRPY